MFKKYAFIALLCATLASCGHQSPTASADAINPVVGNVSFVERFGHAPVASADEDTRIQTHLAYAERTLRQHAPQTLPAALHARRQHVLDLLHEYWQAGVFPRNFVYPNQRRPCFIDRDGRLCAVGYLVAETAGRPVAEKINQQHQYDYLRDMRTPELLAWVETSGLTREECALIQPTYGWLPSPTPVSNKLDTGYGVGTAVWGGFNVALSTVNAKQIGAPVPSKSVAWAGLLSGGGQVLLGSLRMPKDETNNGTATNQTEKTVSVINIGLGTTTMVLSAWNLLSHRQQPTPRTSFGVYAPTKDGLALSMTRQF